MNKNFSHLDTLELRLHNEKGRLAQAKTPYEKEMRSVWVAQIEKEIVWERKKLGLSEITEVVMSDDEMLAELGL